MTIFDGARDLYEITGAVTRPTRIRSTTLRDRIEGVLFVIAMGLAGVMRGGAL